MKKNCNLGARAHPTASEVALVKVVEEHVCVLVILMTQWFIKEILHRSLNLRKLL